MVRWTHRSGDEDQRVNRACVTRAARGFAGRTSWHRWQIIIITTTKITTNRITARITTARLVESTRETWIWMVNRRRNGPSPLRVEKKKLSEKGTRSVLLFLSALYTHELHISSDRGKQAGRIFCMYYESIFSIYIYTCAKSYGTTINVPSTTLLASVSSPSTFDFLDQPWRLLLSI